MASTVTMLIFFPKMYRQHFSETEGRSGRRTAISAPSLRSLRTGARSRGSGDIHGSVADIRRRVTLRSSLGGENQSAAEHVQRADSMVASDALKTQSAADQAHKTDSTAASETMQTQKEVLATSDNGETAEGGNRDPEGDSFHSCKDSVGETQCDQAALAIDAARELDQSQTSSSHGPSQ